MSEHKTTVLIILDGWGVANPKNKGNAITPTTAPHYFKWLKKYPHTELAASGSSVGLFRGQEGNSEAGHLNIGAGRVIKQDALYITEAIKDGSFFKNIAFDQAIHHVKKYKSAIHLLGLVSNGNSAHSCPEHLYALFDLLHQQGLKKIYLHLFTDGRDSGQHDAVQFIHKLRQHFYGTEKIATIMGRLYAMDRNKNWPRTELTYRALTEGVGREVTGAMEALTQAYNSGESDEFILPSIVMDQGAPSAIIQDNDAIIFFNLRSDRARQLTKTFSQPDFERLNLDSFVRRVIPKNISFVAMTDFGPDLPGVLTAFPSRDVVQSLVQILCPSRQLYVAESEKFAHITYFLNGGYAQHFCNEQWVKIESDNVIDFKVDPTMKANELATYVIKAIASREYDFIAVNLANADMVGHTGDFEAAKIAVQTLDKAVERIIAAVLKHQSQAIITADHGNAEEMINTKTGEIDSEHSTNPVPLIVVASPTRFQAWKRPRKNLRRGKLADVAPTILKMMGRPQPKEMTGRSLI